MKRTIPQAQEARGDSGVTALDLLLAAGRPCRGPARRTQSWWGWGRRPPDSPPPGRPEVRGGVRGEPGCPAHPEAPLPPSSGQRQCPALLPARRSPGTWDLGPPFLASVNRRREPPDRSSVGLGVWGVQHGARLGTGARWPGRATAAGREGPSQAPRPGKRVGGGTGPSELDRGWGSLPTKAHL